MSKALNVAVCQINPTLGNFQKNIDIISKNYKSAVEKGADLVVFPEMSITGYPPQDLLNNKEFISQNISCLNELVKSITIPCILGYVDFEDNKKSIEFANNFCEKALLSGVLVIKTGRESVKLSPPLLINKRNIDKAFKIFDNIINDLIKSDAC